MKNTENKKINKINKTVGYTVLGLIIFGLIVLGLINSGIIPKEFADYFKYLSSSVAVIIGGYVLLQSVKQEQDEIKK